MIQNLLMEENNNMDQIQVQDLIDKLKEQIGELTYQIIYRDLVIEAMQKELMAMQDKQQAQVEIMDQE